MTEPDPKEPALVNLPLFRGKVRFNSFDRQLVDVVTKVKSSVMTPEEAEAWAKEHGHSPFVFRPSDEVSTKALKERYWPFALAMAWIPTREPSAAMHAWNSYMTWGAAQFTIEPKFVGAREELLAALRQGRVTASGRADLQRPREDIPAIAWLGLRLVRYGGHDRFYRDEASVAYIDVFVDAEQVRAIWPEPNPGQVKVRRTIAILKAAQGLHNCDRRENSSFSTQSEGDIRGRSLHAVGGRWPCDAIGCQSVSGARRVFFIQSPASSRC
jgi:hypothetical protein